MDPVRATYLAALCLILLGAVLSWQTNETYTWLMVLPAVAAAGVYSLSPQIKWWYWKRHPPDLPVEMAPILDRFALYRSLDLSGKRDFRRRAFLIRENTEFTGMAIDNIPPDVQLMVAASAATVTFYREGFLVPGFENVIFYPHLFPSPQYDRLHSSELYAPDGGIILTLNYFIRSVVEPDKYLQLGIYEYTRALFHTQPELRDRLEPHQLHYPEIHRVTDFSEEALKKYIGLEELDLPALTMTVFYTHPERLARLYPENSAGILKVFPISA